MIKNTDHLLENQRLNALFEYRILDTLPEKEFDDLVSIAQTIIQTPIVLISLIDKGRQWFKARIGLEAQQTDRDISFCTHAITQEEVFVIEDATKDPRFQNNPLVCDEPHIRFYAGAPLITPQGYRLGTLCAIDNTPRKITKEQISQLQKLSRIIVNQLELRKTNHKLENYQDLLNETAKMSALGEMAAGLAHEINNPLTIISGKVSHAKKKLNTDAFDKDEVIGMLDKTLLSVERISKISKSLSSYARNTETDPRESFKLSDVIHETLSLCEQRFTSQNIEISMDLDDSLEITGHSNEITQVLLNLLNNSFYAISSLDAAWIKITTKKQSDQFAHLSLVDSGPGIAEEIQDKIENPFFTTKPPGLGTGMGLSISKRIVKSHQGDLYYNKNSKNTEFIIKLPLN